MALKLYIAVMGPSDYLCFRKKIKFNYCLLRLKYRLYTVLLF